MRLQAGRAPATDGAIAGHGNGRRQGHAPTGSAGLRVSLATLEGGAAAGAYAHGCV